MAKKKKKKKPYRDNPVERFKWAFSSDKNGWRVRIIVSKPIGCVCNLSIKNLMAQVKILAPGE